MLLLITACFLFPDEKEKAEKVRKEGIQVAKEYEERTSREEDEEFVPEQVGGECGDEQGIDEPLFDDCITAEIECSETVLGHTGGGADGWSNGFYQAHYCTPMPKGYGGTERVYRFVAPAHSTVSIDLETPCAELDLFAINWSGKGCPTEAHNAGTCDSDVSPGDGHIELYQDKTPRTYLIAVDGKDGSEAPFTLNISCHQRE